MGEGKSTSALAIAAGFGRQGMRVLLIDADMRAPSLHRTLMHDNENGLSNSLAGGISADAAMRQTTYANVWLLAAGPAPPNPSELLAGRRMKELLAAQSRLLRRDHHRFSPPCWVLPTRPQLAAMVKGVIMVVEAGSTRRDAAKTALRRLQAARAHILGVLFMKFDVKKSVYGYGYGFGYGDVYGYGGDHDPRGHRDGRPVRPFALFGGGRAH